MARWLVILGFVAALLICGYLGQRTVDLQNELDLRSQVNCKIGTALRSAINAASDGEQANGVDPKSLAALRAYANDPSPYCR